MRYSRHYCSQQPVGFGFFQLSKRLAYLKLDLRAFRVLRLTIYTIQRGQYIG